MIHLQYNLGVIFVLLISLTALPSLGEPPSTEPALQRVDVVTFHSRAIDKARQYVVLRPHGYASSDHDWPVLVLLHGRGRHVRSLIDDEVALAHLADAPFLIVFPAGDDGWYIDSPQRPADRYEQYMAELVSDVESRYRVSMNRRQRGLAGWSMGGYGSIRLAQQWPDRFGAVASIIGLLDFPRDDWPGESPYAIPYDRFGRNPQVYQQLNPIRHVHRLQDTVVLLITADRAFDRVMNEHFRHALEAETIDYQWYMLQGGHTFEVVRDALPKVVRFMAEQFDSHDTDLP